MRAIIGLVLASLLVYPANALEPMTDQDAHKMAQTTYQSIEQMVIYFDGDIAALSGTELSVAMYKTASAINSMIGKYREKWGLDQLRASLRTPGGGSALDKYSACPLAGSMFAEAALILATKRASDMIVQKSFQQFREACVVALHAYENGDRASSR
ncbi:hypothetical protein [Roseibium sediminis]|uniref:hypothetical protein n=1 Tax=Roseibium sediminis TaxID=1775174 RepID=UPI00123D219C|nr:hypothetical protein [Roseibium sediminis]